MVCNNQQVGFVSGKDWSLMWLMSSSRLDQLNDNIHVTSKFRSVNLLHQLHTIKENPVLERVNHILYIPVQPDYTIDRIDGEHANDVWGYHHSLATCIHPCLYD